MQAKIIKEMSESPKLFVKNSEKDFTRKRKLTLETVIQLLLPMGGDSLYNELCNIADMMCLLPLHLHLSNKRDKILPFAFEFILNEFTNSYYDLKNYTRYRLFAADGSDLNIFHNPNDADTYFQSTPESKGFNQIHLNALYDLCNKLYVDAIIQSGKKENEYRALTDMVDRPRVPRKVILISDRGYESYNVFAHA